MIDLRHNYPVLGSQRDLFGKLFLADAGFSAQSLQMSPAEGSFENRQIAAGWLSQQGHVVSAGQVLILSGGHHGCLVAVLAFGLLGKTLGIEAYSYGSFRVLADLLGIRLLPISMDAFGMEASSLEEVCKRERLDGLYLMPTVHNPLGTVMSLSRRLEILSICDRYDLKIIEDDAYGFLHEPALPNFAMLAPERCIYVHSFSKPFAPGLKVAYLMVPLSLVHQVASIISVTSSNASPLMNEACSRWVADGTMESVIAEKRTEGARKQQMARSILSALFIEAHPNSWHLWALLPSGMNCDAFKAAAFSRGVDVNSASNFVLPGFACVDAIRIGLGGTQDENLMIEGLEILKGLVVNGI